MSGKVLILGLLAGGAVLALSKKKAKAATAADAPLPPGFRPSDATSAPPVAPPLQGPPTTGPGVVVVPDDGDDDDDDTPPVVVAPVPPLTPTAPPFVPPAAPAPAAPAPVAVPVPLPPAVTDVLENLPEVPIKLPPAAPAPGGDVLEQAGIPVVVPLPPQVTPPPVIELPEEIITPTQEEAQQPTALADDTGAVLVPMLAAEATSTWKRIEPTLKPWQSARGLKVDGKFGPGSALKMAEETGLLPIVRYWPSGAIQSKAVPAFQASLRALAATAEEPRRTQLLAAAEREKGQGFGSKQKPISPLISLSG